METKPYVTCGKCNLQVENTPEAKKEHRAVYCENAAILFEAQKQRMLSRVEELEKERNEFAEELALFAKSEAAKEFEQPTQSNGSDNPKEIVFAVYGIPGEQGSKTARARGYVDREGKVRTKAWVVENNEVKNRSWREAVRQEAIAAMRDHNSEFDFPLTGCLVILQVTFTVKKPGTFPKRRRILPIKRPDVSKLIRSTEDALTDAGFWKDDSQVAYDRLYKVFPNEDRDALNSPGCLIRARIIENVGY